MYREEKAFQWLTCPACKARTKIKLYEDTVLLGFPLYCTKCKREFTVGVIKFNMVVSDEPDA
ncbi:MAG: conjugal transfer protein [Oscillospiraceae bacterium]|nr:conjugal transfer protein [Oscillospiraceae bacterium]